MRMWITAITLVAILPSVALAAAEVKMHNGRPMVFIDGKPRALPGYSSISYAPKRFARQMPWFYPHKMGVYYLSHPFVPGNRQGSLHWVGDKISVEPIAKPSKNTWKHIDDMANEVIKNDPTAYFIMRFGTMEPDSWRKLHPQECFITDDGTITTTPSLASDLALDMASRHFTALIKYCESRPWSNRIIGYANFFRTEGTHEPVIQQWLYDHNPLMVAKWRALLKRKYKTDDALREAHGDASLSLATVDVPRDTLRGPQVDVSRSLYWQHARDNQKLRDYLLLQKELFHKRFRQYAAAMKAGTDRKRFFICDALKQTMIGWNLLNFAKVGSHQRFAYPELMAGSGHMGVAELFDAPGFDGLITPHDYQARNIGGVFEPEGIVDSTVLRGKVFFCEADTRTYTCGRWLDPHYWAPAMNDKEFAAVSWRNLATAMSRGFYLYYMDCAGYNFTSKGIQKIIGRQVEVIKESVDWPHETMPGIAMILDDTSVLETNGNGRPLYEAIQLEWKLGMARCGVPYRIYLFDDLTLDNFPEHRVYYFPNLFKVTDERLALLKKKVFRNGHVVVWGPGSGISDGTTIDAKHTEKLTGFTFETPIFRTFPARKGKPAWKKHLGTHTHMLNVNYIRRTIISNFSHPITRGLKADCVFGGSVPYGPVLFPVDGTPLGMAWTKRNQREVGLAVKEFGQGVAAGAGPGDYAAVFTTSVPLPTELWRGLARYAGAHVYTDTNDVLVASRHIVALHSLKPGPRRIALPEICDVIDVISGKPFATSVAEIRFDLKAPETRVFRLRPADTPSK